MRDRAKVFINNLLHDGPVRFLEVGIHEASTAVRVIESIFARPGSMYFGVDIWDWGGTPIPEAKKVAVDRLSKLGVLEWPNPGPKGFWMDGDIVSLVRSDAIPQGSLDVIYIDSSHKPDRTLLESVLCYELLAPGGFLLWDDYDARNPVMQEVRQAVDPFLSIYSNRMEVIDAEYQLLARKVR
jgi:hypothetical protein